MKTDGIASAASALRYWERKLEATANNLANATTDGFKAERVFAQLLDGNLPGANTSTDRGIGTIRTTGNQFDIATGSDGFFVVRTPQGERWTRGGPWRIDANGNLADADGNLVLGEEGPICVIPPDGISVTGTEVSIDSDGLVRVPGRKSVCLRLEKGGPGPLQHEGGTRFVPPPDRSPMAVGQRDVRQGAIEESNVNSVSTLVEMIAINRNYAFAQKVLTTLDGIRATISNDLAKPA